MVRRTMTMVASLALVLAACSGDGEPSGSTPTTVDLTGQKVRVGGVWSGSEQENFEKVLDAFNQQTGADAQFTPTTRAIDAFLGARIEGGNPPEIAILPNPGLLGDLAAAGNLIEIEDVAGDLVDANYAPLWRELGSHEGTLYGVWLKASNKSLMWYNAGVFTDAGVEAPATWDDLLTVAQTVEDFGVAPFALDGGSGWTLTDWFENVYIRSAGPDLYDQLTNHEIPWTHESVKEALGLLAQVWEKDSWLAGGRNTALQTEFAGSVTQVWAAQPKAAMLYEGDFVADNVRSETEAEIGVDANVFTFPSVNGSAPAVVGGGDVAVMLVDTPAARELIKYFASPDAAEVWAALGGFTSANKTVDLAVYPNEVLRSSAEALANAETFRFDLSDLTPGEFGGNTMFTDFQAFLRDPSDVDGAAEALERHAKQAYS